MAFRTSVNDQITDSVTQAVKSSSNNFGKQAGQQIAAHTIAIAMQNAVAQQQHSYTILNAITARSAEAILDSRTEEAAQLITIANELMTPEKMMTTLSELNEMLNKLDSDNQ